MKRHARLSMRYQGFTLLEMLVAISIFALLSLTAYSGLSSVLTTRKVLDKEMKRLNEVQRSIVLLGRDLRQAAPRFIRDEYGAPQPPMSGNDQHFGAQSPIIEFSRAGYPNPSGVLPRSHLQRVAYRFEDNTLYRLSWPVLDRAIDSQPYITPLCRNITDVRVRYLDNDANWHNAQWPPSAALNQPAQILPQAVEITLELADWGSITRLYPLVGDS